MLKLLIKYATMREKLKKFVRDHLVAEIHVNFYYYDGGAVANKVMINDRIYYFSNPLRKLSFETFWNQNNKS